MFEKVWADHEIDDGLLFVDLHLLHEVTSPQAFDGLRLAGRPVRRRDRTLATVATSMSCPSSSWRRSTGTAPSSTFGSTRWATATRASSTSSGRSWASPSRA